MAERSLVLVGNAGREHVGSHFRDAAAAMGLRTGFCNTNDAFRAPRLVRTFNWRLRGHLPTHLRAFSEQVVQVCRETKPEAMVSTGLAPVDAAALAELGQIGVRRMNFLTDDPWNPQHRAPWFQRALPLYDTVFTPRTANAEDLRRAGCGDVRYLPFAYSEAIHYPEPPAGAEESARYDADVMFAGGADADRLPYMSALMRAGLKVALWGGYWNGQTEMRGVARGNAGPAELRKAVGGARVCLCLVRRANRDGHAMRTWELAAMGGCILAEDTDEHRAILGENGAAAIYFRSIPEMVEKARALAGDEAMRTRLAKAAMERVRGGANTYADRLRTIVETSTK